MNNVITLNNPNQIKPLDMQGANNIGGALHRLSELQAATVITPTAESEIKGLQTFILDELFKHAKEFLGAWFAMHTEYSPFIQGLAGLLRRADAVNSQVYAAQTGQGDGAK